jgi:hypothetical protein
VANVTFDTAGPSSAGTAFTTGPGTWTAVNNGNGIIVGVTTFTGSTNVVTGVTYGGVTVPFLGFVRANNGTAGGVALYGLTGPTCPTGSNTVSVAVSDANNHNAGSVTVTGAGSLGAVVTAFAASPASGLAAPFASTTAGGLIVSAACQGSGGGFTATSPNVKRLEKLTSSNSGSDNLAMGTDPSTGGAVSPAWTIGGSDFWGIVAVEVLPPGNPADGTGQVWGRPWAAPMAGVFGPGEPFTAPAVVLDAPPSVAANAGVAEVRAIANPAAVKRYITGLGGTGAGYFVDNTGAPRLVWGDAVWALCGNAGRWNSGNWQADFDTFCANRAAQGFTVLYGKPIGTTQSLNIDDFGQTFDGLFPFAGTGGANGQSGAAPSSGLAANFWARIDYFLNAARANGITVFLSATGYASDWETAGTWGGNLNNTEAQAYGAAIGARYASQPNLVWMVEDDYFGNVDSKLDAFLTGLRGADTAHVISIENMPESTSRKTLDAAPSTTAWGNTNGAFNFTYSYNQEYYGPERAYAETSPITVIHGDGYFYQGGGGGTYSATFDRAYRQGSWWALASGARGRIHGSEAIWQWQTSALSDSGTEWYYAHNAAAIAAAYSGLPGWHLLVPDTASALITAGRGTRASAFTSGGGGGQYEPAFTSAYVAASRTPDGGSGSSLAVLYLPAHTTVTIDQSKMTAGYAAFWMDPVTGVMTSTTAGSTYNSTAQGNNSQGDPDWVLVLMSVTAATASPGPATATVTAPPPVPAVGAQAGVASVTAAATGPAPAATAAPPAATATAGAPAAGHSATASPSPAAVLAAAPSPGPAGTAQPPAAPVAATAPAATVSTVTAGQATASVAAVSAAAPGPVPAVAASAGVAAVTVTAAAPALAGQTAASPAAVSAAAPGPAAAATAQPPAAPVAATAPAATGSGVQAGTAHAGVATVTATATATSAAAAARPGPAAVSSAAQPGAPSAAAMAGAAASSATAPAAAAQTGRAGQPPAAAATVTASPARPAAAAFAGVAAVAVSAPAPAAAAHSPVVFGTAAIVSAPPASAVPGSSSPGARPLGGPIATATAEGSS